MKQGKVILIDKISSITESESEKLKEKLAEKKIVVEFAAEFRKDGFYSLPEALLSLLQKGVKRVSAFPLSLGEKYEISLYWGTY